MGRVAPIASASTATLSRTASETAETTPVLVSLAAVSWDFPLVGRTRMLTEAWARLEQPTVFVQVPSYRTALQRILSVFGRREDVPVVRPWPSYPSLWWPRLRVGELERSMRRSARALRRRLTEHFDWDRAVGIVVSPLWVPWLDELPFRHVIYDCIDDLQVHVWRPDLAPLYIEWERRLLARASGAVATADRLAEQMLQQRPGLPIARIRNGVDVDRFERLASEAPVPPDLPATGRPCVGFVGALYEWVDWDLVHATAQRMPEFEFVLVGPHDGRGEISRLSALPNVHFLGRKPYDEVPAYCNAFTVCWVPFKQDDVGRAANPVKIYEYLALGKPVVTTPVADTELMGSHVSVARDVDEMVGHLRDAIDGAPENAERRVAFARQNTWESRASEYVRFISSLDRRGGSSTQQP